MPFPPRLVALALVVSVFAGCSEDGAFRFRWRLALAQGRGPLTCASANARSILVEVHEQSTGAHQDETFPCDAPEGVISGLAAGTYGVWFQLYSLESFPTPGLERSPDLVDATAGPFELEAGGTRDVTLEVPLSYVSLNWRIVSARDVISCDQAGAAKVRVLPIVGKYTGLGQFELDCAAGSGITGVIPATIYHGAVVQLVGKAGEELASVAAPPEPHAANFDLRAGQILDLGTVDFPVP